MRRTLLPVAALTMAGLLGIAAADAADGEFDVVGPASSNAHRATASFADLEYSVPFYGRLWSDHSWDRPDMPEAAATTRSQFIGEVAMVERPGGDLDLSFAVEGQSETPGYEVCDKPGVCQEVTVRVTPNGLLYLHMPRDSEDDRFGSTYLGGFPRRSVELSASDTESGLKVYREVMVNPPPAAAGCEEYGDATPETYTCLFLRQLLPPGQAGDADVDTLRARLPGLVQNRDNYRLVFAEEFNGGPVAPDASGCSNGLSTLDDSIWNYFDACQNLDSRGETCSNVTGGAFVMGVAGTCGITMMGPFGSVSLNTYGNLHMKYGYLEFRYTFDLKRWSGIYYNLNLLLYTNGYKLRYLRDQYGVEVHDWEDFLKNSEIEIDLFETPGLYDISHQYANWDYYDKGLTPIRTAKWADYCESWRHRGYVRNPRGCKSDDTFTVTRGIEWTPRGYRTYIKVDGIHNSLTIVPEDNIYIHYKPNGVDPDDITGNARKQYFEYLVPGNSGTLLEQVAIGHIPLPIAMSSWGFMDHRHPYIRSRVKVDYIRVWQPENHYADMEPVYQ